MEKVKFSDFRIVPDINSVCRKEISDEEYFSPKYGHYISNSRLKNIDPLNGGSPTLYQKNPKISSDSLRVGSAVHECLLQPESFELAPKVDRPTCKLGLVMDYIPDFLKDGIGLDDAIKQAAIKADYYTSSIDSKLENIKETWEAYSKRLEKLDKTPTDKVRKILADKEWDIVNGCLESCKANQDIMNLLHPTNPFGDPIEAHFEDALFMDLHVIYKEKNCATLKFKMKADSWTIDKDSKIITLNDLKTTGKSVQCFMREGGSFDHYDYSRQMAAYSYILWYYCLKYYPTCLNDEWQIKANMLVVETIPNFWSKAYVVNPSQLTVGKRKFKELLCRVAYCEMFGYDKEIEFE